MDEVWSYELGNEAWEDVRQQDNGFGDAGADEIEGCGEYNNVEDIVY
jgi:hypothetical protein